MSSSKLRVLCIPMAAVGHVHPMLAVASALSSKGHEVTIATEKSWEGKFCPLGFEEEIFEENNSKDDKGPASHWVDMIRKLQAAFRQDAFEAFDTAQEVVRSNAKPWDPASADKRIGEIINKVKPDIIIYNAYRWHTSVLFADIPVVQLMTTHPLMVLEGDKLPPSSFGLSIHSDPSTWPKYIQKREYHRKLDTNADKRLVHLTSLGAPLPGRGVFEYLSSNLNVLLYPRALVKYYLDKYENREHFFVLDHALRPTDSTFVVPDKIKNLSGRLVFVSMGSLGSCDIELMKTLITALAKAAPKYKFIVAKGSMHDHFDLADNMWGDRYVPQLGVLPLVDLAIIHGGNNSFTEALYFGKPMIIIPLFFDQRDNAQLAVDAKVGAKFYPFKQSGEELIQLMDDVLNNEQILTNVKRISKEIQESQSMNELVEKIEYVAKHPKKPPVL